MIPDEKTRERLAEASCPSCGHPVPWHRVSGGLPCACWPGGGETRCSCRLTFADALLPLIDTLLRERAEGISAAIEAARDRLHPAFSEGDGNLPRGYTNAARIARTFGGESE